MEPGITGQDKGSQQQVLRYEYVLGALSDIGDELCRVTSFDAQLKSLLHLLLGTLGVSKGGIFIYDSAASNLSLKCSWKLSKKALVHHIHRSNVEELEKVAKPIFLPQTEVPFLDELFKGFATDDLSCFAILKVREKFLGLVVVGQKLQKSAFEERETEFLSTLSRNISVAINNFLLLNELRETNRRLDEKIQEVSILYQATQMIASEIQLQALLELAMNLIIEISEGSRGSIWLFDEERNGLSRKSAFGSGDEPLEYVDLNDTQIGAKIVLEKEVLIVNTDQPAPAPLSELDQKVFGTSFIILPILNQGEFLGFIHLTEKTNQTAFSERDQR
ncbi:MAG TPA: GAF domain-containing protein, partial [Candidatus Ozemobacteraceae bacterium]|nr:GAF domain-containing protein [Candidatus Ozemobacteraceae bacterium]